MMHNTNRLTAGYAPELAAQIAKTHPGQAHWAATGPFGATCDECSAYGYWRIIQNNHGDTVRSKFCRNACGKFHQLTGRHGPAIPPTAEACRHFERRGDSDADRRAAAAR